MLVHDTRILFLRGRICFGKSVIVDPSLTMSLQETDQNLSTTNNTIPDPQSLMPAPFVQLPQPTVSAQPAIAGPSTVESDHRIPASVPSS